MNTLIVALTGASGIVYGLRLLEHLSVLKKKYGKVYALYSENAQKVALIEEGLNLADYLASLGVDAVFSWKNLDSPIASSSRLVNSEMVIIPASLNTIAKIASGVQDTLVTRVACNILRLRKTLVLVVRDTPLSPIDLRNLYRLAIAGAIVLPAIPAFYPKPKSVTDIVDFVVGKVMDVLGVEHELYKRWKPNSE